MARSIRNLPEQFDRGIDISGTRIERNLQQLEGKLTATPPALVRHKGTASYLVWGYSPKVAPDCNLPWMSEINGGSSAATLQTPTTFQNRTRHKAIAQPAIIPATFGELFTWEVSFVVPESCLLDQIEIDLAAEQAWYPNDFKAGAVPPPDKSPGDFLSDCTIQVMTDNQLEPQARRFCSVEAGSFRASLGANLMNLNAINPAADTMQPPMPAALVELYAAHFSIGCHVLLGRNTSVRVCITIPQYALPIVTGWSQLPWQTQVWGCQARLIRPNS